MSSSNYGHHADTVENLFVQRKCRTEYDSFMIALDLANMSFSDFCCTFSIEAELACDEDKAEAINASIRTLFKAFFLETGLILGVIHHEAEEKADELDGGAFSVEGVYELTPSGKKYEKSITRKFWTTWG